MGEMVNALFGGGAAKKAEQEATRQREMGDIARARQEQEMATQQQETDAQVRATGRAARGTRLLVAAGEAGGLASKLGG